MIKRKVIGYRYESTIPVGRFQVESDYLNGKLYLEPPSDEDLCSAEEFGKAIIKAVEDTKKHDKKEAKKC